MLASLLLTLACIALIIRWILGSAQLTVRAMVPNLWPVVFVLGMMGWGSVPVDSTTVMIAAAVLGLAVDDTLHALGSYRALLLKHGAEQAVLLTFRKVAPAHVLTSAILALGFLAVSLSSFVPVARFGALLGMGILAALMADLLLVPALLATVSPAAAAKLKPAAAR
jgi:predicted RND superfamily exporter protein